MAPVVLVVSAAVATVVRLASVPKQAFDTMAAAAKSAQANRLENNPRRVRILSH